MQTRPNCVVAFYLPARPDVAYDLGLQGKLLVIEESLRLFWTISLASDHDFPY